MQERDIVALNLTETHKTVQNIKTRGAFTVSIADAAHMAEVQGLATAYYRELASRKGKVDQRLTQFRWLLEELRVSLFAQELKTPMPVSVKRLARVWESIRRL